MLELFSAVLPSYPDSGDDIRNGLTRAQTVFEHPILFGVFTGGTLALGHLVLGFGQSGFVRWWRSLVIFFTACLSLSSGPIATLILQAGLMVWNRLLKTFSFRWKVLWGVAIASYFLIDLASNQTPMQFYISRFTFDQQTGWVRIAIWDHGSASVMNHPLFGVGFGEWDRPRWMTSSIDMFWLLNGVRYGLPGAISIQLAFFAAVFAVGARRQTEGMLADYRTAYLITMAAFYIVGWTVHFWGSPYVLFLFLLGSGLWLLEAPAEQQAKTRRRRRDAHDAV
jgi:O-antigen ligase